MGGLLPLIIFGSNDYRNGLAIVVIWGLGTSLTLILWLMGIWEKGERGDRKIRRGGDGIRADL